jgi:hypothetical protein
METALIHLQPEQKRRLAKRARARGLSFSQEVRNALDLYLQLPVGSESELATLAAAARQASERMIAQLDQTLVFVRRIRHRWEKKR